MHPSFKKHSPIDILFLLTTIYFSITTLHAEVFGSARTDILSVYFTAIIIVFFFLLTFTLEKNKENRSFDLVKIDWILIAVLTFLSLAIKIPLALEAPIWLDEYTQFKGAYLPHKSHDSILYFASMQQQPPLDYYLSAFIGSVFGYNPITIRLHPLLFSTLFTATIYLSLLTFTKNRIASFTPALLSIIIPIFLFFSIEARPLALGLFLGILSLHYFLECFNKCDWRSLSKLLIAESFFVFSIGLQPEILLLTIALSTLPLAFKNQYRPAFFKTFFVHTAVFIVFIPVIYSNITVSSEARKFKGNILESFSSALSKFGSEIVINFFNPLLYSTTLFIFIAIVLLLLTHSRKKLKENVFLQKSLLICISSCFIFPILFIITFKTLINWEMYPRYYIVFFIFPVYGIGLITYWISDFLQSDKRKTIIILLSTLFIGIQVYELVGKPNTRAKITNRNNRIHWNHVWQHMDPLLETDDHVFLFDFHDLGDWRPSIYVGYEFYLQPKNWYKLHKFIPRIGLHPSNRLGDFLASDSKVNKIYLIAQSYRSNAFPIEFIQKANLPAKVEYVGLTAIWTFDDKNSVLDMLKRVTEQFPKKPFIFSAYETLIDWALAYKQKDLAWKYLKQMSKIETEEKRNITGSMVDNQKVLKRRVQAYIKRIENY